jgi:tetratricopeptide (TPR) repeat protein
MKKFYSTALGLLIGFLFSTANAADIAGKSADDKLAQLAASKRAAVVRLAVMRTPTYWEAWSVGVFISSDGLALVDLQGLVKQKIPTVTIANNKKVPFGKILATFPEQELALMKFNHSPKHWLQIAPLEPKVGETIALVPLMQEDPWMGKVSPVVGPIITKRSDLTENQRVNRFTEVLSLGSGLSQLQRSALGPGCFAIDRQGCLVAFTNAIESLGEQTLITVSPVVALTEEISRLAKTGEELKFPLIKAHNLIDPASIDPDFHPMNLASSRQDWKEYDRLLAKLLIRYPESSQLKARIKFQKFRSIEGSLLSDFPEPSPSQPITHQVKEWSARSRALAMQEEFDAAIEASKKAIALSPKDYPVDRLMLAQLYAHLKRIDEAEALFSETSPMYSDRIDVADQYRGILVKQRKWERLEVIKKKIEELEDIYRRR